jgi:hypothetical protein
MPDDFNNVELVTLAIYFLGGDSGYVDTEDIAVKTNQMAPGRFTWTKYPDQINIENVRKRLSDAKNPMKGGYVLGSTKKGWMLSEKGLKLCNQRARELKKKDVSRRPLDKKDIAWRSREKRRMMASLAYEKVNTRKAELVTIQEAEAFFRLDDYVRGQARERKLTRFIAAFVNDPDLNQVIEVLIKKVRSNERNDGPRE